ncbi:hypothetical protein B0H14DRAFT_2639989 [Mycena olivaceomarginata]|nr:hypothetical protein B0H14DRAFT_2639989 [Mycena olivaceomarginata]
METGDGEWLLRVLCTRGVVHASALHARGSGRVVLAGDVLGAWGGDKSSAGNGEQPSHMLHMQEAMKVVLGSTADTGVGRWRQCAAGGSQCAGRRQGVIGGKACQRCMLCVWLVVRLGLVFTLVYCRAHGGGRNSRMAPWAASGATGHGTRIRLTGVPKLTIVSLCFTCIGDRGGGWTYLLALKQVPSPSPVLRSAVLSACHVDLDDGDEEKRQAGNTACSGAKNSPPILKTIGQGLTQTRHYTWKG